MVYSGSSTNKTDRHDITEILLKLELNTIKQTNLTIFFYFFRVPPGTRPPPIGVGAPSLGKSSDLQEGDDTMKNLRKTFAGIFGDM